MHGLTQLLFAISSMALLALLLEFVPYITPVNSPPTSIAVSTRTLSTSSIVNNPISFAFFAILRATSCLDRIAKSARSPSRWSRLQVTLHSVEYSLQLELAAHLGAMCLLRRLASRRCGPTCSVY